MQDDEREEQMRRVRYWVGQAESALDMSTAALSRIGELDGAWSEEFASDAEVLRSKLTELRDMISCKEGHEPEQAGDVIFGAEAARALLAERKRRAPSPLNSE